ncbi:MAG: hypothetical protein ACJ739_07155 [Acidimicrobiales bacterium]
MTNLASKLSELPARQGQAPWPDHEYVKGWGVMGLPFDSGHYLALRVFPENDFSPYKTVWHRDPDGQWSIFVDGPRFDTACPRYYGPACTRVEHASVDLTWTGPMSLRVTADEAHLNWTLNATETGLLRAINAMSARLPDWTWRRPSLLRARELLARRVLGMGDIRMSGTMPSGHTGTLMPKRMYFIDDSTATLDDKDLGHAARMRATPDIGSFPLPARGVLAIGQAAWRILDHDEYARTREETLSTRQS